LGRVIGRTGAAALAADRKIRENAGSKNSDMLIGSHLDFFSEVK